MIEINKSLSHAYGKPNINLSINCLSKNTLAILSLRTCCYFHSNHDLRDSFNNNNNFFFESLKKIVARDVNKNIFILEILSARHHLHMQFVIINK